VVRCRSGAEGPLARRGRPWASSALMLAWPARPHPPSGASVSRAQVRSASEGPPAAAATMAVSRLITGSCLSRSRAPALVRTWTPDVGAVAVGVGQAAGRRFRGWTGHRRPAGSSPAFLWTERGHGLCPGMRSRRAAAAASRVRPAHKPAGRGWKRRASRMLRTCRSSWLRYQGCSG
jgi:hypothetical protein